MSRTQPYPFRPAALRLIGAAVGGVGLLAALGADPATDGVRASPEANPPGQVMAQVGNSPGSDAGSGPITPGTPDMKAVQDLLGRAAADATTPGKSADLLSLLAGHDRDRMAAPGDWSDVDRAAAAFNSAWQAKFGASFNLADKIPVVMTEPAVHVAGLDAPPPATGPAATQPTAVRMKNVTVVLSDPGRHSVARIRLVNEGTGKSEWRFDLSDATTAAALHDSLLRHLTAITDAQQRWPTDVAQAYVYVTQHVLSAVAEAGAAR